MSRLSERPFLRLLVPVLVPLAALALAGCGATGGADAGGPGAASLTVESVTLRMAAGVNDGWPVPVELVRLADGAAMDELLEMNAEDWFGGPGEAFRVANTDALYDAWEVVPGTTTGPFDVRVAGRYGGVLFCNLRGEEPQLPVRFERDGDVLVSIADDGCALAGGCPSRRPGLLSVSWGGRTCVGRALLRPDRPTRIREISFEVESGANGNWPVSVELVRTPDQAMVNELMDMGTRVWFSEVGDEFRNANPDVRFDSWEVVPGTVAGPYRIPLDARVAGVLFCNADSAFGPILLDAAASQTVFIGSRGCEVVARARAWSW